MSSAEQSTGTVLTHYRLGEVLGHGGMGVVYRAVDERLERDVAIKLLTVDVLSRPNARTRFRNEALTLSKLNHPHIAAVYDFDTVNGTDFLVMEYVPGENLDDRLRRGPLHQVEVMRLGLQLADGLAAAHLVGIVHRDLKPGNLRITPAGQLKILDFGLAASAAGPPLSETTTTKEDFRPIEGTMPYMSPEQLCSETVDPRSDVYAAGAVLYELATGERPFPQRQSARLIGAILTSPPTPPSQVNDAISSALQRVILKALAKGPESRYQSAQDLYAALRLVYDRAAAVRSFPGTGRRRLAALLGIVGSTFAAALSRPDAMN
jgi:serine/threonine protein kinase